MEITNKKKIRNLYFLIAWGGILSFAVILIWKNVDAANWLVMQHSFDWQFSDFFRQVIYASDLKNIYFNTDDAPFPPFAYLFFHLIYKINPIDAPVSLESWKLAQDHQYSLLIFVMVFIFIAIFFVEIVKKILNLPEKDTFIFIFSVLLSAPFMSGAIERGNIAIVVCVLLLWAMYWKDSDIAWKRELALLLIAISAGLKIYPAVFGLIYLKEKRWKEAIRLIIYGIIFFFLPFAFTGGFAGFKQYIEMIRNLGNLYYIMWTNIRCYWASFIAKLGYDGNILLVGMLLENIYLLLCIISTFKTKKTWKQILFLSGILSLYIPVSYRYVSIYMLIPLVFWFHQQKGNWNDYIYCILFSLIFTIPTYSYFIGGEVDFCIFTPIYLLMLYSIIETWFLEKAPSQNKDVDTTELEERK